MNKALTKSLRFHRKILPDYKLQFELSLLWASAQVLNNCKNKIGGSFSVLENFEPSVFPLQDCDREARADRSMNRDGMIKLAVKEILMDIMLNTQLSPTDHQPDVQ